MANIGLGDDQQHLMICDGCNVHKPHEHRCHGLNTITRFGDILSTACECPGCREADEWMEKRRAEQKQTKEKEVVRKILDIMQKNPGWKQLSASDMREFEGIKAFFDSTGDVLMTFVQLGPLVTKLLDVVEQDKVGQVK